MKKGNYNTDILLDNYKLLSKEEQDAVFQLIKTMAETACKRETGYSIKDYNKVLEVAEKEQAYTHSEVLNDITEWLSSKKKKATA